MTSCDPRRKVVFVLPQPPDRPSGAVKVVHRVSEYLAHRGHRVAIAHPAQSLRKTRHPADIGGSCCRAPVPGFTTSFVAASSGPADTRAFDTAVATSWHVVPSTAALFPAAARKVLLHMDFEGHVLGDSQTQQAIAAAIRVPWPLVTISDCIRELVVPLRKRPVAVIPPAVDTCVYDIKIPVSDDQRTLIGFPGRAETAKRTGDAVRALEQVRRLLGSQLRAWCFGADQLPDLPSWVTHIRAPSDDELAGLYNRTQVFVVPSLAEGFGLPGAEAMACGSALVSTRNGGVDMYAVDGSSALLCPPGDLPGLAEAVLRLLRDEPLRQQIATTRAASVRRRTWAQAGAEFEAVLDGTHRDLGGRATGGQ